MALSYYSLCGLIASYWFAGDFVLKHSGPMLAATGFGVGAVIVAGVSYTLNLSPKEVALYCLIIVLIVPIGRTAAAAMFMSGRGMVGSISQKEGAIAVVIGYIVAVSLLAVLRWRAPGFIELHE